MTKEYLEQFASELCEQPVHILYQSVSGKWYEQKYISGFTDIEPNKVYGICIDDNHITYDFKTGKTEEGILKSFVTQYISKYEMKQYIMKDGKLVHPTRKEALARLKNSDRVSKHHFYTTLYGIGYFCFIMSTSTFKKTHDILADYLKSKGVSYTNEFSEAGWVYRFVINQKVEVHNELLRELKLENQL